MKDTTVPEDITLGGGQHAPLLDARLTADGTVHVVVGGTWKVGEHPPPDASIRNLLTAPRARRLLLSAKDLVDWDTSLVAVLTRLTALARTRDLPVERPPELPAGVCNLIDLALTVPPRTDTGREGKEKGLLEQVGTAVLALPTKTSDVLSFIGEITLSFMRLIRGTAVYSRRDIFLCLRETSSGALPIVALISMLVGLILAFVGVVQLRMFGAEIYVASLVSIGMTRIMGAIMTGIVLAGRTGASYAAIIGSMQVNEEVDALVSLGVPPTDYLVLPRFIALTVMTPLLVLYADLMGIFGGFVVGSLILDIDPVEYLEFTRKSLSFSHLFVGLVHGLAFGAVVAICGCYQGLRCSRSAEGVGTATTAAVVNSIVYIILVTAALTVLFNAVGL